MPRVPKAKKIAKKGANMSCEICLTCVHKKKLNLICQLAARPFLVRKF